MIRDEILYDDRQIVPFVFSDVQEIMLKKWGGAWTEYRNKWKNATSESGLVEAVPLYLVLELNSFCNLRCIMCKHAKDDPTLEKKSMPMHMIEKIIEEAKKLRIPSVNIGSGTECTLHPRFHEIARKIKETGAIDKFFLTNGTTMNAQMINTIFDGDYERVEISLDAATNKTYSAIRKNGSLMKIEDGIYQLIEEKAKRGMKYPIIRLSFCVQELNVDEIDTFYEKWAGRVDIIEYQKVSKLCDDKKAVVNDMTCNQPFNRITVDYNGNIYPCCSILFQNAYSLGNIADVTLLQAWNGERMHAIRDGIIRHKPLPHCESCYRSLS